MKRLMILLIGLTVLLSYLSRASEPTEELVIVTWVGTTHVPFLIQTLPHTSTTETCDNRRKRMAHKLELANEELENEGKPPIGYTLMCREVPSG